jgi:hypothetical protein
MKFNKKRALECKLIKEHPEKPNHYIYDIEVGEVDGTTWKATSCGSDMSDALNRLLWNKRTSKIERTIQKAPDSYLVLLWFMLTILPGSITSAQTGNFIWILLSILINVIITISWVCLKKWVE